MAHFKNNQFWSSMRCFLLITLYLTISLHYDTVNAAVAHRNRKRKTSSDEVRSKTCSSSICSEEASFYLKNMNLDVDPCNDFYEFVCGNFVKTTVIPEDKSRTGMFDIIEKQLQNELHNEIKTAFKPNDLITFKKVKTHYQNCMNETQIEEVDTKPFFDLLNGLGGWPLLLGEKWNENSYKWEETAYKISTLGYMPRFPFQLTVSDDATNSSKKILLVLSAGTTVSEPYFLNENKSLNAYESYMLDIAQMLGVNEETARKEVKEILDFEVKLFKIQTTPDVLMDVSPVDTQKSINDLSQYYPSIPWLEMFNKLLNPSGVSINETEKVEVVDLDHIPKFEKLINETPRRVLANYQIWNVVYDVIDYMPKRFDERQLDFRKITRGVAERPDRETRCMDEIMMAFGTAVSSMYIREYFNKEIRDNAKELVQNIKVQTKRNLEKIDWMDEKTRKIALEKLNAMGTLVAYPDELLDDEKIDKYYSNLEIESGNYFKGISNVAEYVRDQLFKELISNGVEDWSWAAEAASVNAFYMPSKNQIIIPAGILRGLYYRYERPEYLNYGSIGSIIGHEVTHGFDSNGRKYDQKGNYVNWWKNETAEQYLRKSRCISDVYSNYTVPEIGLNVKGNLTLAENIADYGGLKAAYYAYLKWTESRNVSEPCLPDLDYSPKQMFWVSAASAWCSKATKESLTNAIYKDPHSPAVARVVVGYSNIDEFAIDFNCKIGRKMNPEKKCNMW